MEAITREEMFLSDIAGDTKYNLEPITRTEKLLKKIAENGTGGGGVSSWNDLTDKPFGEETVIDETLYPETEFTSEDLTYGYFILENFDATKFKVGEKYDVYISGKETVAECKWLSQNGQSITYLGNLAIATDVWPNSGEDFLIGLEDSQGSPNSLLYLSENVSLPATLKIQKEVKSVSKIPAEYLPEGYPYAEEGVIFEEATVEMGEAAINKVLPIVLGGTYKVKWNGTEYTCVAYEFDATAMGVGVLTVIGNGVNFGLPDTGEPFAIAPLEVGGVTMVMSLDGAETATVGITGEVVHKMDAKYLPETGGTLFVDVTSVLDKIQNEVDPVITEINYDTFAPAWYAGRSIAFKTNGEYAGAQYLSTLIPMGIAYAAALQSVLVSVWVNGTLKSVQFPNGTWTPPV